MPASPPVQYLARSDGHRLAYQHWPGNERNFGLLYLSGFRSNMLGVKAQACAEYAQQRGIPFVRFDYFGHGQSSGRFIEGTLSRWLDDVLAVLDQLTTGPQILVGSSMGAWLALLAARRRADRIKAIVAIAAAVDFTEDLIWAQCSDAVKAQLTEQGYFNYQGEGNTEAYPITRALIEDGRKHLLLRQPLVLGLPVYCLHGQHDDSIPWQTSQRLAEVISGAEASVTLIPDGDHALSTPAQLQQLFALLEQATEHIAAS